MSKVSKKNPTKVSVKNQGTNPITPLSQQLSLKWKVQHFFSSNRNLWLLVIVLLGCSVYWQTKDFEFTQDDTLYSTGNSATQKGIKGIPDVFSHGSLNYYTVEPTNSGIYRPLTLLTFCIEYELFKGFKPLNGHLINIILYFLVLIIVGVCLVELFRKRSIPLIVPLLILLLYALHPTHTEVVASIKSRDTLLSTFLLFSSLFIYIKLHSKARIWGKILYGFVFFLALVSKEEGITFIPIVFVISYIFFKRGFFDSIKDMLPFLISGLLFLFLRSVVLDEPTDIYNTPLNNVIYTLDAQHKAATNLYIYLVYIKLLLFPFQLSYDYSFSQITAKTFSNGWVLVSFFLFVFFIIASWKSLVKRSVLGFGLLYYLISFSIFANLTEGTTIGSTVGERFLFLPSLGFSFLLVYSLYLLTRKFSDVKILRGLAMSLVFAIAIGYFFQSYYRAKVWKNNLVLFESGLKTAPNSWRVHTNLAEHYRRLALINSSNDSLKKIKKDSIQLWFLKARNEYERSFHIINEQSSIPYLNFFNYGDVLLNLKDTAAAKYVYSKSTQLSQNMSAAWYNLASLYYYEGDYQKAIEAYLRALTANSPNFFLTYKNLGSSYFMLKDYTKALDYYKAALKYGSDNEVKSSISSITDYLNQIKSNAYLPSAEPLIRPDASTPESYLAAGMTAYRNGDFRNAIIYFNSFEPTYNSSGGYSRYPEYLTTWAQSYLNLRDIRKAKQLFKTVLKSNSRNYLALQNLAVIASQHEKNYADAEYYFLQCLQADSPNYFFVYSSLGFLYWIQNQQDKAIQSFENSLKYGSSPAILNNLYQLWSQKGDQEKASYYQKLLNNN